MILPWRFPNSLIVVVILYDILYTFCFYVLYYHLTQVLALICARPSVLGVNLVPNIKLVAKEKTHFPTDPTTNIFRNFVYSRS